LPGVSALGAVEVLVAVGLILPPLVGVAIGLAAWAAAGLAIYQVLACGVHLARAEAKDAPMNAVLGTVALAAAWLATSL
jgi:hypothetical protein